MQKGLKKIDLDLKKYCTLDERYRILYKLKKCMAYREKEVVKTYESMELEGNILHIYGKDGYGFCVDFRVNEPTFGNICG